MTDAPLPRLPEPIIQSRRRWIPSLVWTIPILAALIGLSLVAQVLWQRGPTISVSFATAEGIEPGKTKVKYKDVDIGQVTEVHLDQDRSRVLVSIDLIKDARQFAVTDSRFWVVRPRLAGSGISGLGTLLSGSYIGVDGGRSTERRDEFTGLDQPPVVASDIPGHRFRLRAQDIGSLDVGSPVYFRRVQVGHVESFVLEPNGQQITLDIFVKSPYDRFVTDETRFWHASGFDLRMDAGGVKLETQSLATILMGGIAFETPPAATAAPAAQDGAQFTLAGDHAEALKVPDGSSQMVVLRFRQSIRGLVVGASVDFRGVEIGRVRSIGLSYDERAGDFTSPVVVEIFPDRLAGMSSKASDTQRRARVGDLVQRGLRAQLRSGSLLTGQLYVALDFFPEAPRARMDTRNDPMELPTVSSDLEELQRQALSILSKLEKIPFDTLGQDAHRVMVSLDSSLKRIDSMAQRVDATMLPELRETLVEMRRTMEATQAGLAPDSPLQQDTRQALRGVAEATRSLKALTDGLERNPESVLKGKRGTDQ